GVLVPLARDARRVMALHDLGERRTVAGAAGPDGHARTRLELPWIARDGRDRVAATQRLVEDAAADRAGGADQDDVHALVSFIRSRVACVVSAGASCGTL